MRILLVDPPRKYWKIFRFFAPSPGLASLAAFLEGKHDVHVMDCYGLHDPWGALEERIVELQPDAVGVTCTVVSATYDAIHAAMLVKTVAPRAAVMAGGYVATALWEELLGTGVIDYVVRGEGEHTLLELLDALAAGLDCAEVQGVASLKDGAPHAAPPRPLVERLDDLPSYAWNRFPMDRYEIQPLGGKRAMVYTGSRGCANRCAFCSESFLWGSVWRSYSAGRIVSDIEEIVRRHGRNVIFLGDNDFFASRERLEGFIEEMQRKRVKAWFWCEATARGVVESRDLLAHLRKVGLTNVQVGLESVSPAVLANYDKPHTPALMREALEALRESGMCAMGLFIWGDWDDTVQSLEEAVDFIVKHCQFIAPNLINPFPGTPYWRRCVEEGRIEVRNLWKYNQHHALMPTRELSREKVEEAYLSRVFSGKVALRFLQGLVSPHWLARLWARGFIGLDILMKLPWLNRGLTADFDAYCARRGRDVPPWRFPFPKE